MTLEILTLLLIFQTKHLIADYYLQFRYMYENKGKEEGWFIPLFDHAGIHALGTFAIIFIYHMIIDDKGYENLIILILASLFDFITHFITDRIKATSKSTIDTNKFWYNLGLDQAVHHIVGILIIWSIV